MSPLQILAWSLAVPALVATVWLLTLYRGRIASVGKAIRRQTGCACGDGTDPALPAASVVVVAGNDAEALSRLLERLFDQHYPPGMEVIVVNDGKNEDVKDAVTRFKHERSLPNLSYTFAPPGMRNVSRRKLALTLGIKASANPVIVCLTEQSRIRSTEWLQRMMEPFANPRIEVVAGVAMPDVRNDRTRGSRYRSFTHGADAVEWLSAALGGHTWRAHRANMAFRRNLFFASGGFSSALNLRGGDDDIFISRVSRPDNTATVVASQAQVSYAHPSSRHEFRSGRAARYYTSRDLGLPCKRFFAASSAMAWIFVLTTLCSLPLAINLRDWVLTALLGLCTVALCVVLTLTWRYTLKALHCRAAGMMVPPMMLLRPLSNFRHKARSRRHRNEYHTWLS